VVLVIDLNPLSRTSRKASVTIVDEVGRAVGVLLDEIVNEKYIRNKWNNELILKDALEIISKSMEIF
jgi:4-phosphopantoate--beta-alanine ligase